MSGRELFDVFAPQQSPWSVWAKPVLFAELNAVLGNPSTYDWNELLAALDVSWVEPPDGHTLVIADLPGRESVILGIALARAGYRPIPLYNGADGPSAVIDVDPIIQYLALGAEFLRTLRLDPKAPPVFMLDSQRLRQKTSPSPGSFDNRWVAFPQDFPSAAFLLSKGIHEVIICYGRLQFEGEKRWTEPSYVHKSVAEDLMHVLLPWQEAGIQIKAKQMNEPGGASGPPVPITVQTPSWFRTSFRRWMVTFGLRRNSAGGFGSRVPEASSGGGGGGYYG